MIRFTVPLRSFRRVALMLGGWLASPIVFGAPPAVMTSPHALPIASSSVDLDLMMSPAARTHWLRRSRGLPHSLPRRCKGASPSVRRLGSVC